jgi:hypothetical protein
MLKGDATLAVPLNVPLLTFTTTKLFVTLVPTDTVPNGRLLGVT